MFIKIENGEPIGNPVVHTNMWYLFPNFNWNRIITSEMVAELGYALYEFSQQPEITLYKKLVEGKPLLRPENGIYYQNWQVVDMSEEEKQVVNFNKGQEVRFERNLKLQETDYVLLPDSPISAEKKQEYIMYRQQLRDLPNQSGFPWDITWPQLP